MNDIDQPIQEALDRYVPTYDDATPRWEDVLARAGERRDTPRSRHRVAIILAATLLLALAVGVQQGLAQRVIDSFSGDPAPPRTATALRVA